MRASLLIVTGLLAFLGALLVPAYVRALDPTVVQRAGAGTLDVLTEAQQQARQDRLGCAELLAQAGPIADVRGAGDTVQSIQRQARSRPTPAVWGSTDSLLQQVLGGGAGGLTNAASVMDVVLPEGQRATALEFLGSLRRVDVFELLKNRRLERTALFPAVPSASGQALDSAILLTGLLIQADAMTPRLRREIEELAAAANRGIRQRADRDGLPEHHLAGQADDVGPTGGVFAADPECDGAAESDAADHVVTGGRFRGVCGADPGPLRGGGGRVPCAIPEGRSAGLAVRPQGGQGGLSLLLERQEAIHFSAVRQWLGELPVLGGVLGLFASLAARSTFLALLLKYLLWFDGAFCLARAMVLLTPPPAELERPYFLKRSSLFRQQTIGVLAVVLIFAFGEPYLARANQRVEPLPVLRLNQTGTTLQPEVPKPARTMSGNEMSWLALALFFVVQLIVYVFCVIRLGEIKKHTGSSHLKLQLLDNEENLFDSGLYVGLGGTVLQLVLLAFQVGTQNLMVAYASTLFGIAFVSVLKIFHVRRFRRLLLLEMAAQRDAGHAYDASPYST
ncbi:MAG: hypothetical protein M5U12_31335 [Verrucomicrobia bacterium]|nr:hypothetical protein [Verrucomicrobiota bacterium]